MNEATVNSVEIPISNAKNEAAISVSNVNDVNAGVFSDDTLKPTEVKFFSLLYGMVTTQKVSWFYSNIYFQFVLK